MGRCDNKEDDMKTRRAMVLVLALMLAVAWTAPLDAHGGNCPGDHKKGEKKQCPSMKKDKVKCEKAGKDCCLTCCADLSRCKDEDKVEVGYRGKDHRFCSTKCAAKFLKDPGKCLEEAGKKKGKCCPKGKKEGKAK